MTGPRDRFLEEVADELPLPDIRVRETLEELDAHLTDSVAEMVARGTAPEVAEAEAIARLGPPAALAHGLASAHRGGAQLLAAAGAGTWASVSVGVLGSLLGWVMIVVASILAMTLGRTAADWLGVHVSLSWTGGWNTVLTAAGLSLGAVLAGAAAVRAVAVRGWRTPAEVRIPVTAVGTVALGWVVLVAFQAPLNWASVLVLLFVPISFGVGARVESIELPGVRTAGVALLIGLLAVTAVSLGATDAGGATSYQWSETTVGYEMIAPWWQDPATGEAMDFPSGSSGWSVPGVEEVSLQAASSAVLTRFRDFRLEAWRAEVPHDGWRLLPGQREPFATAAASVEGTTVSGTLAFNQMPGVDWAEVVVTAIGPDGQRYLLNASGPEPTDFYGSVWSWFTALGR